MRRAIVRASGLFITSIFIIALQVVSSLTSWGQPLPALQGDAFTAGWSSEIVSSEQIPTFLQYLQDRRANNFTAYKQEVSIAIEAFRATNTLLTARGSEPLFCQSDDPAEMWYIDSLEKYAKTRPEFSDYPSSYWMEVLLQVMMLEYPCR